MLYDSSHACIITYWPNPNTSNLVVSIDLNIVVRPAVVHIDTGFDPLMCGRSAVLDASLRLELISEACCNLYPSSNHQLEECHGQTVISSLLSHNLYITIIMTIYLLHLHIEEPESIAHYRVTLHTSIVALAPPSALRVRLGMS